MSLKQSVSIALKVVFLTIIPVILFMVGAVLSGLAGLAEISVPDSAASGTGIFVMFVVALSQTVVFACLILSWATDHRRPV